MSDALTCLLVAIACGVAYYVGRRLGYAIMDWMFGPL
jgi:hypothetical protein